MCIRDSVITNLPPGNHTMHCIQAVTHVRNDSYDNNHVKFRKIAATVTVIGIAAITLTSKHLVYCFSTYYLT